VSVSVSCPEFVSVSVLCRFTCSRVKGNDKDNDYDVLIKFLVD